MQHLSTGVKCQWGQWVNWGACPTWPLFPRDLKHVVSVYSPKLEFNGIQSGLCLEMIRSVDNKICMANIWWHWHYMGHHLCHTLLQGLYFSKSCAVSLLPPWLLFSWCWPMIAHSVTIWRMIPVQCPSRYPCCYPSGRRWGIKSIQEGFIGPKGVVHNMGSCEQLPCWAMQHTSLIWKSQQQGQNPRTRSIDQIIQVCDLSIDCQRRRCHAEILEHRNCRQNPRRERYNSSTTLNWSK